jgi:DNA polymerase V
VVAFVNGERLVKRLHRRAARVALVAENPCYPTLEIQEGMELEIWGVVVGKFKRFVA